MTAKSLLELDAEFGATAFDFRGCAFSAPLLTGTRGNGPLVPSWS